MANKRAIASWPAQPKRDKLGGLSRGYRHEDFMAVIVVELLALRVLLVHTARASTGEQYASCRRLTASSVARRRFAARRRARRHTARSRRDRQPRSIRDQRSSIRRTRRLRDELNGAPIWPPKGEGCDKLVACCTALAAIEKSLGLACLMATGRDKTCAAAFATAIAVATEGSYALPASCAR